MSIREIIDTLHTLTEMRGEAPSKKMISFLAHQ
jgi:hypothetical protein